MADDHKLGVFVTIPIVGRRRIHHFDSQADVVWLWPGWRGVHAVPVTLTYLASIGGEVVRP